MFMTIRSSSRWEMDRDASRCVARVGSAKNQVFQNVDWLEQHVKKQRKLRALFLVSALCVWKIITMVPSYYLLG
jgi:hypothetical protein